MALARAPQKSIAVLPFENESGDASQQYFADGLSQDLITALTQVAGLKVISRNSAFQFRGSKDSPAAIAALLGVAHLLEGSVQRQGAEVRINAELVNAADGSTLWSQHYDRPYTDLFALQDEITRTVADVLKAKLLPGKAAMQSDRPPSGSLQAWQAYQQGSFYLEERGTEVDLRKALAYFIAATRLDPRYAAAFAKLSIIWNNLAVAYLSDAQQEQAYANARAAADTALALAPELAQAHSARGALLLHADFDWRGARAEYLRASQLAPNYSGTLWFLGNLDATLGQVRSAVTLTRKVLASDPLAANSYYWLSQYLSGLGRLDEAEQAIDKAIELQPTADSHHEQLAVIATQRGDAVAALAAAQAEPAGPWHDVAMALALQIGPDHAAADAALKKLIDDLADQAPYQIAEVYALRRDPDHTFQWLDRARANRDPGIANLLLRFLPFALQGRPALRRVLQQGRPAHHHRCRGDEVERADNPLRPAACTPASRIGLRFSPSASRRY